MCTMPSFAVDSQGHLVKFDAILMLSIGSLMEFAAPHVRLLNHFTMMLKAKQPVIWLPPCLQIKMRSSA